MAINNMGLDEKDKPEKSAIAKIDPRHSKLEDIFLTNPVESVTECTRITPILPLSDTEAESYSNLYDVPVTSAHLRYREKKGKAKSSPIKNPPDTRHTKAE